MNAAVLQSPLEDLERTTLLLGGVVIVSLAGLLGGMQYVIIGLAIGLALLVVRRPAEAIPAGLLFMLAAMVLLPSTARLQFLDSRTVDVSWQMYYWAIGSLIIVLAALYGVGLPSLLRAPTALKAFLFVAVVSSIYGAMRGNSLGYVFGQLYGSILFILYFAISCSVGDEELLFQRLKTYGLLIALAFFVYYASVFGQFGFHKEDTSLTSQLGLLATFLFAKGLIEKRSSWLASSTVVLCASLLFFMRHILLTFLFAMVLTVGLQNLYRRRRILCFGIAALILLPSIFPYGAQFVLDLLQEKEPGIYEILPEGTRDSKTLLDRNIELFTSAALFFQSPVLGAGMGAGFAWFRPDEQAPVDKAYIDNGWAYLIVKMGGAGILAFGWLLAIVLRCMSRRSLAISITLLAILMIAMFSEPICFQFTTSPIAGALAGLLYGKKYPRARLIRAPMMA